MPTRGVNQYRSSFYKVRNKGEYDMEKRKVTVIGAGHVGSHVALSLAVEHVADEVVLVDRDPKKAEAQALDIFDAMSFENHAVYVHDGDYADVEDSDVVVIAIGMPRKPGQDRTGMLDDSIVMCDELIDSLSPYKIPGVLISITNPCDVIADYLRKGLHLDKNKAFGTGTMLDTTRLKRVLSQMTGVSRSSIQGYAMGEHGETSMIPYSVIRIGGRDYHEFGLSDEEVLKEVRAGGWIIIKGKLSTEFGIGRAATELAEAVIRDEKKILPASVLLDGEYGQKDVQIGVPCMIGKDGIEQIIELPMSADEKAAFDYSCDVVRGNIATAMKKSQRGVK